eukprot:478561_1
MNGKRVLVEGFIHIIHKCNSLNQNDSIISIIPLSIIDLCYNYTFQTVRYLVLYCGTYDGQSQSNRINQLQTLNLSTFTSNTINMRFVSNKDKKKDKFCFASYLISRDTIKSTPKWIFETTHTNIEYNYDMLIRIGGYNHGCRCCGHRQKKNCDVMLFNTSINQENENGYILPLPDLDSTLSSSTIVRKYINNDIILLCIGGYSRNRRNYKSTNVVRQLNLTTREWQITDRKLLNPREGSHVINLYGWKQEKDNMLIIFGGCDDKTTEMFVAEEGNNNNNNNN